MGEIDAVEAMRNLGQLLDHVEHGEETVITRRSRAVVRLVPAASGFDQGKARRAVLRLSKGVTLGGLRIKDLIREGSAGKVPRGLATNAPSVRLYQSAPPSAG